MNRTIKIIKYLCFLLLAFNWAVSANDLTPNYDKADRVLVIKSERKLHLYKEDKVLLDKVFSETRS